MTVKITQIDAAKDLTVLKVEGRLAATDAVLLTEIVEKLAAGELFSIDMSGITFIDQTGAAIIRRLEEFGAELIGVDFFVRSVIDTYSNGNK